MDDATLAAAQRLADELHQETMDTAAANLALIEAVEGTRPMTPGERDCYELGLEGGYLATLQVLVRRGLVASPES